LGIARHLGWAVVVAASAGTQIVDRRRIELIEPAVPAAPIEHDSQPLAGAAAAGTVGWRRCRADASPVG
jgi:hypothetical protein